MSARRTGVVWYVVLVLGLAILGGLASTHFGWPESPLQDLRFIGGYVAGYAAIALGLSMLVRQRAIMGSLPFAPGVYVFPLDLVDARTRTLVLHPLATLQAFDVMHHEGSRGYTRSTLRFVFPTTTFTFETRDRARAEEEATAVEQARANIASVLEEGGSLANLAAVDPFADARARRFSPARDHGLKARGRPTWTRHIWAITVAAAVVFGVGSWLARNRASDERAFAHVASTLDLGAADAYRRAGGRRATEVETVILPRAQLALARKKSDPNERAEAIGALLERHPRGVVDREIRASLAEAQHAVFLTRLGSTSGLHAFIARWPDVLDVTAARSAMVDLHRRTLEDFSKRAATADESVMAVVPVLLAYEQASGKPIDVRFRSHKVASLADAEKYVTAALGDDTAKQHQGELESALVADSGLQAAVVVALQRTLRRVFRADVVTLRLGAPLEGPAPIPGTPPLLEVAAPVIVVDYRASWEHASYASPDPRARFVGIVVSFDVALQVPSEPRVLHFGTVVEPPKTLPFEYAVIDPAFQPLLVAPGAKDVAIDTHVYTSMLVRAFDQLASRWATAFVVDAAAPARP